MREVTKESGMELLKLVLLLIAVGLFAAVILSTLTVVLIVAIVGWLTVSVASFLTREGKGRGRAPEVRRPARQEGT